MSARTRPARATPPLAGEPRALVHHLPSELLQRPVKVLVVGCGGTGSEIASGLPALHQAMLAYGHPGGLNALFIDGDIVSEANIVRQPFARSDVGHPKATLLVGRLNAFWGLDWRASARHLVDGNRALGADLVIGCVDSRTARATIARCVTRGAVHDRPTYWLDLGNDAATGQFLLGQPEGARVAPGDVRLPTVAELYPETIDAAGDGADTRPSCSAVEALTRQEPFVNRTLAAHALAMLARLFRYGELAYHGGYVNLATGRSISLSVSPDQWDRIRSMNAAPRRQIRPRQEAARA